VDGASRPSGAPGGVLCRPALRDLAGAGRLLAARCPLPAHRAPAARPARKGEAPVGDLGWRDAGCGRRPGGLCGAQRRRWVRGSPAALGLRAALRRLRAPHGRPGLAGRALGHVRAGRDPGEARGLARGHRFGPGPGVRPGRPPGRGGHAGGRRAALRTLGMGAGPPRCPLARRGCAGGGLARGRVPADRGIRGGGRLGPGNLWPGPDRGARPARRVPPGPPCLPGADGLPRRSWAGGAPAGSAGRSRRCGCPGLAAR
jgi:hypothetical protein